MGASKMEVVVAASCTGHRQALACEETYITVPVHHSANHYILLSRDIPVEEAILHG